MKDQRIRACSKLGGCKEEGDAPEGEETAEKPAKKLRVSNKFSPFPFSDFPHDSLGSCHKLNRRLGLSSRSSLSPAVPTSCRARAPSAGPDASTRPGRHFRCGKVPRRATRLLESTGRGR